MILASLAAHADVLALEVTGAPTCICGGVVRVVDPFLTLRAGDRIDVPGGAGLTVLYTDNGRREAWRGPVTFTVGALTSTGVGAAVTDLGPAVGHDFAAIPLLLRRAEHDRAAQTLLRGAATEQAGLDDADQARLAAARSTALRLETGVAPSDIVGEMYLAAVLLELGMATEAAEVLGRAATACPTCTAPRELLRWATGR